MTSYSISIDANGGTGGSVRPSSYDDSGYNQASQLTDPTRGGWIFDYWTTNRGSVSGKVLSIPAGTTGSITVTAHWRPDYYRIDIDANGGTGGGFVADYYTSESSQTVSIRSTDLPTRSGYTLTGWTVSRNGGGGSSPSASLSSVSIPARSYGNIGLTANWSAKSFTVSFDGNGGDPSRSSMSVTYGSTYGSLPSCSRTGYTFDGWYTSATGGSHITSSSRVSITSNQTLYAHWIGVGSVATFNPNGGNAPSFTTLNITYGSAYGTLPTCTRDGYTFAGWWTSASGGTRIEASTIVSVTGNQTLYARWSNTLTVTFDAMGGSVDPATKEVRRYDQYGVLPVPTKAGNSFGGWYTASSRGVLVESTTVVQNENNHYLYARWIPDRVTVYFDVPQGVTVSPSYKVVEKTFPYGWLPTPTRTGYVFVKWSSAASGSDEIKSSTIVPVDNPPTRLYAIWRAEQHVVHFDVNGGFQIMAADNDIVYTYDQPYGLLAPSIYRRGMAWGDWRFWGGRIPMWDGTYHFGEVGYASAAAAAFLGWFDDPVDGNEIKETDTCLLLEDTTFYAHWDYSRLVTDVTFDPCGGKLDGSTDPAVFQFLLFDFTGAYKFGRLPVPVSQNGAAFIGWYNMPDDRVFFGSVNMNTFEGFFQPSGEGWLSTSNHAKYADAYKVKGSSYCVDGLDDPPTLLQLTQLGQGGWGARTYYAWWSLRYEVTLDYACSNNYSNISKVIATYGEKLPEAVGSYTTEVWNEEEICYDEVEIPVYAPAVPTRAGYVFKGFYEFPNGQGKRYYKPVDAYRVAEGNYGVVLAHCEADQPWDRYGGGTIYAYWENASDPAPAFVTLTFQTMNDLPLSFTTKRVIPGEPIGDLPKLLVDYWDDIYWAPLPNRRPNVYPSTICTFTEDTTLVITQWSSVLFTVTYVTNGGSNVSQGRYTYDANRTFRLASGPTKSGFTFGGWYESPLYDGSPITELPAGAHGDKVLYAKWIAPGYTLTFNANGGSVSVSSKPVTKGSQYGDLPTPTKSGMQFEGWFTSASGGTRIVCTDVFTGSASMVVYAHWSVLPPDPGGGSAVWGYVKYKIKLELNGGSLTDSGYVLKYQSGVSKLLPTASQVSKPGATFGGWYATADFTGEAVSAIPATATGSKTFYAKWV